MNEKNYTIDDIYALTEPEAQALAIERMEIKEHAVYFVDFGGYFRYSCLVFKNGHHIYYANDYELHHPKKTREELRALYIAGRNSILFTEAEIAAPVKDHGEFSRREYFLRNYYGMQADKLSIFGDFRSDDKIKAYEEQKKAHPYYSAVSFGWYADGDFVRHLAELYDKLLAAKDAMADDFEYQKDAFKREMADHEYHINWQADFDTLGAFGNIQWHGDDAEALQKYFDELDFNETQRRAYLAARSEFLKEASENGWY